MSPGPTFDRVYVALKDQLTGGSFAPGDPLEPAAIGEELNASITPVRDALHRLVGENMVEAPRNDGFRVPAPTEAEIRDLYGWNQALLDLALRRHPHRLPRPHLLAAKPGPPAGPDTPAGLFRDIARRSDNPELERVLDNLSDRLAAFRVAEIRLFEDLGQELAALRAALAADDVAALKRGIAAYHRRRQRCAPQLLLAARLRPAPEPSNNR